MNENNSGQT
jgi:hypothetical protein